MLCINAWDRLLKSKHDGELLIPIPGALRR
jgi:hypothetical protein